MSNQHDPPLKSDSAAKRKLNARLYYRNMFALPTPTPNPTPPPVPQNPTQDSPPAPPTPSDPTPDPTPSPFSFPTPPCLSSLSLTSPTTYTPAPTTPTPTPTPTQTPPPPPLPTTTLTYTLPSPNTPPIHLHCSTHSPYPYPTFTPHTTISLPLPRPLKLILTITPFTLPVTSSQVKQESDEEGKGGLGGLGEQETKEERAKREVTDEEKEMEVFNSNLERVLRDIKENQGLACVYELAADYMYVIVRASDGKQGKIYRVVNVFRDVYACRTCVDANLPYNVHFSDAISEIVSKFNNEKQKIKFGVKKILDKAFRYVQSKRQLEENKKKIEWTIVEEARAKEKLIEVAEEMKREKEERKAIEAKKIEMYETLTKKKRDPLMDDYLTEEEENELEFKIGEFQIELMTLPILINHCEEENKKREETIRYKQMLLKQKLETKERLIRQRNEVAQAYVNNCAAHNIPLDAKLINEDYITDPDYALPFKVPRDHMYRCEKCEYLSNPTQCCDIIRCCFECLREEIYEKKLIECPYCSKKYEFDERGFPILTRKTIKMMKFQSHP